MMFRAAGLILMLCLTASQGRNVMHHHKKEQQNLNHGISILENAEPSLSVIMDVIRKDEELTTVSETLNEPEQVRRTEKQQKSDDACRHVQCKPGRVCKTDADGWATCKCANAGHCLERHGKRVCGSDGRFYGNHCEMHRRACIRNERISAIRDPRVCLQQLDRVPEHSLQEEAKSSLKGSRPLQKVGNSSVKENQSFLKQDHFPTTTDHASPKKETPDFAGSRLSLEQNQDDEQHIRCTRREVDKMVQSLMKSKCSHLQGKNCISDAEWNQSVANSIFSDLDINSNFHLELLELNTAGTTLHDLHKLSPLCHLEDLFSFYDQNQDALLSLSEFYLALGISKHISQVSQTVVVAGTSLELKCEVPDRTGLLWKRNGRVLRDVYNDEIKILDDSSLYIHETTLNHIGNYSCFDNASQNVICSHKVAVQVSPIVRISPLTQFHASGSTVTLKCHAEGVPEPDLIWDFNEKSIPLQSDHFLLLHSNHTLQIRDTQYLHDTGAFKCRAQNAVGTSQDIATVFIENSDIPLYGRIEEPYELFVVFYDKGYSINEPGRCHVRHVVTGDFSTFRFKPDYGISLVPSLCEPNRTCSWGDAVNVRNKFVFVSQPQLNRLIVVEIRDRFNPVEVIPTDLVPVQVDYVEHLDEVWVLCWNQGMINNAAKSIIIIRQASSNIQHHLIHLQPTGNGFESFSAIYLPPNNALNHHYNYGFVVDQNQETTYKIDLVSMKSVKKVNIGCSPVSVAFVAFGGKVVVNCNQPDKEVHSHSVIIDYLTDEVSEAPELTGDPYVSPDSRYLVMVDNYRRLVSVYEISDEGTMEHRFDENSGMSISDVAFLTSERSYGFFASSSDKNSILYMNLVTGQVETVEGVGESPSVSDWPWGLNSRAIVAGGVFSDFLMTPSTDSVVVIDGRRCHLQCEWQETFHANVIVWAEVSWL